MIDPARKAVNERPRRRSSLRLRAAPLPDLGGRRRALAAVALGTLLAGCGFRPRGSAPGGETTGSLYVEAPPALQIELESALPGSALRRASSRETADAVLVVASEGFERRVISVDPYEGSEREAEIAYRVEFRTGRGGASAVMDTQRITLRRDFLFTPEEVVAKEHEEERIRAELRREAAARILRHVAAAVR